MGGILHKLFKGLQRILNLEDKTTPIFNVWIESPRGKWRQLGVPNKSWRLYLHMLNQFITYIYEPFLDPEVYSGFIFNRGCKSWWEHLLWSDYLTKYAYIIEVDLSSGFPNLNRKALSQALESDGLIPPPLKNLILHHLSSPLVESPSFPTWETYTENAMNQAWRKSSRSVHMGLGISPILFVITQHWILNRLNLKTSDLTYKWYADDGSFYLTYQGLKSLITKNLSINLILELIKGKPPVLSIIDIQDHVCRCASEPNEYNREVDKLRQLLISKFDWLDQLRKSDILSYNKSDLLVDFDDGMLFDDLYSTEEASPLSNKLTTTNEDDPYAANIPITFVPPEKKPISMPSTWVSVDSPMSRTVELHLRLQQAASTLTSLRDFIAEKSFQYSDVIRVAPGKGVCTHARSTIATINYRIAYHCRVYNRCHSAMLKLGAGNEDLDNFHVLHPQDIRSSSALLNPNEPGSSGIKLFWIWQTADKAATTSEGLHECLWIYFDSYTPTLNWVHVVNQVHWLRWYGVKLPMHGWDQFSVLFLQ